MEEVISETVEPRNPDYPVDPDFDPLDPDYLADPYYACFRREAPVFYAPKIDFWVVSRHEDIQSIVKDLETFSNARVQEPLRPLTPEALENLKKGVRVTPTTSTADPPSTSARELTQRIPDLRLSPPDQRFEFDPNMSFRGTKELWVEWTPVDATSGATGR